MSSHAPSSDAAAILVAAGSSSRMRVPGAAAGPRKPWLELAGRPLLAHVLGAFQAAPSVAEVVVVAHADDVERVRALAREEGATKLGAVVPGGATRAASVRAGLEAITGDAALVAIHDAARPLVTPELVERVLERTRVAGAALPVLPVVDTLQRVRDDHAVEPVPRDDLVRAQTPQCFDRARMTELVETHADDAVTDDASLWERHVGPVALVTGDAANLKVTVPEDLALARHHHERRRTS